MEKLKMLRMEEIQGGDWDAACGFAIGVGMVAAFTTSPIAPATWGIIGTVVVGACGGAAAKRIYL